MRQLTRQRLYAGATALVTAIALAVVIGPAVAEAGPTCHAGTASDFNGDGIADLAITEFGVDQPGLHILYGTRSGLTAGASGTALNDQLLPSPTHTNTFGEALAPFDYNGDGCTDLAVGDADAPDGNATSSGQVDIYLGSPTGLTKVAKVLDLSELGLTPHEGENFGTALAAGDFNSDGKDDLVVGAIGDNSRAGAIYVIPGATAGPFAHAKKFAQGDGLVPGASEPDDQFGNALAVGDLNDDHIPDVVVGDAGENDKAGAVVAIRGSGTSSLLTATGVKAWTQNTTGVPGTAEAGDGFGTAIAIGDFDHDHHADLAVGVPNEGVGSIREAGTVDVLYGGSTGLTATGAQAWTQNSTDVAGSAEEFDNFGRTLAAGDFDGDGRADLAIGVPAEALGSVVSAGEVQVLYGAGTAGLSGNRSQTWDQSTPGISGTAEAQDEFGTSLAAISVRSASRDDLVIGDPSEGLDGVQHAGIVEFIPSSLAGLTATNSQIWADGTAGVKGTRCNCLFGFQLG